MTGHAALPHYHWSDANSYRHQECRETPLRLRGRRFLGPWITKRSTALTGTETTSFKHACGPSPKVGCRRRKHIARRPLPGTARTSSATLLRSRWAEPLWFGKSQRELGCVDQLRPDGERCATVSPSQVGCVNSLGINVGMSGHTCAQCCVANVTFCTMRQRRYE